LSATRRRAGLALIELVVAILIIALLAGAFYGLWRHGKGKQKSIPAQVKDKAVGVDCQNMLQQTRAGIQMAMIDNDDRPPPSIPNDIAQWAKCPETGQAYSYDPQTGRVWCTTPGHEKL
jgi:prepilin-type N-terminal cleavage/methylation domain-containing protein